MSTLADLLDQHAATSLHKQLALADYIADRPWQLNLSEGTITFGDEYTFPVQVLGTEAEQVQTWLWAWANDASAIPPGLLRAAQQLRALGEQTGIAELTEAELPLATVDGHRLALIAAGVCGADCYYRGPYAGGAVFVLLDAPQVRQAAERSALRFVTVFSQAIGLLPLRHRVALNHYAADLGWATRATAQGIDVQAPDGMLIHAAFDAQERLSELTTTLRSSAG
jgi:hypothetical protein